jgi:TP901-1 family phage major tail protein
MGITKGRDLMLFVGAVASAKSIAYATSASLEITADSTEISHKDVVNDWKTATIQKKSWTATSENLYSLDESNGENISDLMQSFNSEEVLALTFAEKAVGNAPYTPTYPLWTGNAIISSLSLTAADGENATYTASFSGVGPLRYITEAPTKAPASKIASGESSMKFNQPDEKI